MSAPPLPSFVLKESPESALEGRERPHLARAVLAVAKRLHSGEREKQRSAARRKKR
jgi:hypothetical protein